MLTTKNVVMVHLNGQTVDNTLDNGKMENNMEKVYILTEMEEKEKEIGNKEKE